MDVPSNLIALYQSTTRLYADKAAYFVLATCINKQEQEFFNQAKGYLNAMEISLQYNDVAGFTNFLNASSTLLLALPQYQRIVIPAQNINYNDSFTYTFPFILA